MAYERPAEPAHYRELADQARRIFVEHEPADPATARARALRHVVEHCDITIEPDTLFLGGENPFFFNLLLPALQADRHSREGQHAPQVAIRRPSRRFTRLWRDRLDEASERLRRASAFHATCFEGHITPGLQFILGQGIAGLRHRLQHHLEPHRADVARPAPPAATAAPEGGLAAEPRDGGARARPADPEQAARLRRVNFYRAGLLACESVSLYARRYREGAERLARESSDPARASELSCASQVLARVPDNPAETFHEALQSYWLAYVLTTLEMGGCCPGGGLGLGRLDQFLYPYYRRDLEQGRMTRAQALELMELFLLAFRHEDYYTPHQPFTPGSQASLGGLTPAGADAANELSELILEASLRIAMPAPYISLRLHREAPERWWLAAAGYIIGGLGFPVVNDEAIIPAMLRHGRELEDARDYICSCCYENTIPGREAFHPNACYLNLPLVLELALNQGRSLLTGELLGCETPAPAELETFDSVMDAFRAQLHYVCERMVALVHHADRSHMAHRRYPLMSLFFDDCLERGQDVCAGGARYNLTGCIAAGLPNVINSLGAIRECVFRQHALSMTDVAEALRAGFVGYEPRRVGLRAAPKWGNDDERVDDLAPLVTDALYAELCNRRNPRGGRWQLALYSFVANVDLGKAVGADASGRGAREPLTRNLNPAWGTDGQGPTAVLCSLSAIDFTQAPNGSSLDLRFDPAPFLSAAGRDKFAGFLRAFVNLGVMEMQITMVDTETLLAARKEPEKFPHLMVKVAGYSARFVDLPVHEQEEIIRRSASAV